MAWANDGYIVQIQSGFVVADIDTPGQIAVHAQRMAPYSILHMRMEASSELKQQATHFRANHHLVNETRNVRYCRGDSEVLVSWIGFEKEHDGEWKSHAQILKDMPKNSEISCISQEKEIWKMKFWTYIISQNILNNLKFLEHCDKSINFIY